MSRLTDVVRRWFERMRGRSPEASVRSPSGQTVARASRVRSDPRISARAVAHAKVRAQSLATSTPELLPRIEGVVRAEWRRLYREPSLAEMPLEEGSADSHVLGLLSVHPSGYVRETAVRRLAEIEDGSELPYLLLRWNDWVPQVQALARQAVFARIRDDYAGAFAHNFPLVERLARAQRVDHTPMTQSLAQLLSGKSATDAFLAVVLSGSQQARRGVTRFLFDHVPTAVPTLVRASMSSKDTLIRSWLTPVIERLLPEAEAIPLLQRLAADSSPSVRRESLTALARISSAEARSYLERGLLDPSVAVRDTSRFLLGQSRTELAAKYRTAIHAPATRRLLASAIAGLGEVGDSSDAELAAPHLSDPTAYVRRAAVKCVMRLAPGAFADRIVDLLQDPSPSVSAAARDALRTEAQTLSRSRLLEIFANATAIHARRNVILLMARLRKWQAITALFEIANDADPEIATLASRHIQDWNWHYNKSQTTPTRREIDDLTIALARSPADLKRIVDEIRFAVQGFA